MPTAHPAAKPTASSGGENDLRALFARQAAEADRVLAMDHFFIVGCQKTGTTWLQALLNGHPDICCSGEARLGGWLLPQLAQAVRSYNEGQRMGDLGSLDGDNVAQLFRVASALVMAKWTSGRTVRFMGEKTPEHALCMNFLGQAFPGAKFIHTIRDPRDAAVSGWKHNLREGKPEFARQFPTFAAYVEYFAAQHYVRYVQSARAWGEANPARYTEVRYEDLHARPHDEARRALEFLGADASEAGVRACLEAGSFERLSGGRKRGEGDDASHFRKGLVGDWQSDFDEASLVALEKHAGPMMRQLGYA